MSSPPQQPLHVQFPSLPAPPKSGNTAPSQSGANAPALVKVSDGRKIYTVRGVTFEVDQHYELIKAIGLGAYGLVCSAVDLRYVPGSPHFDKDLIDRESKGGMTIKNKGGKLCKFTPPSRTGTTAAAAAATAATSSSGGDMASLIVQNPPAVIVPTLRHDPYARQRLSNNLPSPYVAIKKVPKLFNDLVDGKRVLREVKILQHLRGHENIVRLHDLLYPRQAKDTFRDLYIVTELLDTDLHLVLKSRQPLEEDHLRFIVYQLIKSLVYTHSSGIIHRDLKPGNLLLTGSCELKVCDYGLARGGILLPGADIIQHGAVVPQPQATLPGVTPLKPGLLAPGSSAAFVQASPMIDQLHKKQPNVSYEKSVESKQLTPQVGHLSSGTHSSASNAGIDLTDYVITRYYRPPELLIMSHYNHAVDMWSLGCIFAEIILHKPLFPGKDYLSQLTMIAQTQGLCHMPASADQLETCFVGGAEGKNYLKDLLFGRAAGSRRRTGGESPGQTSSNTESPNSPSVTSPGKSAANLDVLRTNLFGPDGHRYISDAAMAFLGPVLSFDPTKRPSALEALRHPYFAKMYAAEDEIWKDNTMSVFESKHAKNLTAEEASHEAQYESEDEDQTSMWEFDQRDLQEPDLRELFWNEIERFHRRRERFAKPGTIIAGRSNSSNNPSPATRTISPQRGSNAK